MNIITFEKEELRDSLLCLDDNRASHIINILKSSVGDELRVGQINGDMGVANIVSIEANSVSLEVFNLDQKQDHKDISIIMALPRPQTIKKVLELSGVFAVKNLSFIKSKKVEKSYFSSSVLKSSSIDSFLIKGMQQGVKTRKPVVSIYNSFNDGIAQVLDSDASKQCNTKYIADLYNSNKMESSDCLNPVLLAIGPEGGWINDEIKHFYENGFKSISLGSSILRVEQAVCAALSQIELLYS